VEPIRAVSPTVSGTYKSGESYRKWNRLLKATVQAVAFFIRNGTVLHYESKEIIVLPN
jgi:hypothetical protein